MYKKPTGVIPFDVYGDNIVPTYEEEIFFTHLKYEISRQLPDSQMDIYLHRNKDASLCIFLDGVRIGKAVMYKKRHYLEYNSAICHQSFFHAEGMQKMLLQIPAFVRTIKVQVSSFD